jgi:2',3'-cyclic-nucleotide 2'-phosphodiesterase (5'-nucleotidase family)
MFPQVSGVTMTVDRDAPAAARVREVNVNGQPLDPNRIYTVAIPDFVLRQGDGYTMFTGQPIKVGPEAGDMISAALEKFVTARHDIAPAVDGRISVR